MHKLALYDMYLSRMIVVLGVCCTLSVFLYGIFLLMAVTHTASRTEAERQINKISAHLGDIEMTYLTQQKALTPQRAAELGFVKPLTVSTVFASAGSKTLTLNEIR